jgi:hypothetical protein
MTMSSMAGKVVSFLFNYLSGKLLLIPNSAIRSTTAQSHNVAPKTQTVHVRLLSGNNGLQSSITHKDLIVTINHPINDTILVW